MNQPNPYNKKSVYGYLFLKTIDMGFFMYYLCTPFYGNFQLN